MKNKFLRLLMFVFFFIPLIGLAGYLFFSTLGQSFNKRLSLQLTSIEQINEGEIDFKESYGDIIVRTIDRVGDGHIHVLLHEGVSREEALKILARKKLELDSRKIKAGFNSGKHGLMNLTNEEIALCGKFYEKDGGYRIDEAHAVRNIFIQAYEVNSTGGVVWLEKPKVRYHVSKAQIISALGKPKFEDERTLLYDLGSLNDVSGQANLNFDDGKLTGFEVMTVFLNSSKDSPDQVP